MRKYVTNISDAFMVGFPTGLGKDFWKMNQTAKTLVTETGKVRAVLVYNEPALLRKNQIIRKLEERGVEVARTYEAARVPPAENLTDVSLVIMQASGVTDGTLSRWSGVSTSAGARFLRLPHQTSMGEWRTLEEWVARAITSARVAKPSAAEQELVSRWKFELEQSQRTNAELTVAKRQLEGDLSTKNRECDELRERLSGIESNASRIHAALSTKLKQLEEANTHHRDTVEKLMSRLEEAKHTKAAGSGDLPELILKLVSLVDEDLIEPSDALKRIVRQVNGA